MFGKGGGALSTWIKEFCELVFIQTLQAFIYAIVIVFIVKILGTGNSAAGDDRNTAVGIICVMALTAIFKVEDILRKIFGFGPTKADHGNALKTLGKTAIAMKLGASVLDNGRKILGGAGAVLGASAAKSKAKKNYLKDVEAYEKDTGMKKADGATSALGAGANTSANNSSNRKIDKVKRDQKIKLQNDAARARNLASMETDARKKKALMEEAKAKMEQSKKIDYYIPEGAESQSAFGTSNAAQSVAQSYSGDKPLPKDYYQKMRQFEKSYNSEIDSINKKKREGFKNIVKGLAETGAATVGFVAGGIIGGADGDLTEAAQGAVAGMGIGDKAASFVVDNASSVVDLGAGVVNKGLQKAAGKVIEVRDGNSTSTKSSKTSSSTTSTRNVSNSSTSTMTSNTSRNNNGSSSRPKVTSTFSQEVMEKDSAASKSSSSTSRSRSTTSTRNVSNSSTTTTISNSGRNTNVSTSKPSITATFSQEKVEKDSNMDSVEHVIIEAPANDPEPIIEVVSDRERATSERGPIVSNERNSRRSRSTSSRTVSTSISDPVITSGMGVHRGGTAANKNVIQNVKNSLSLQNKIVPSKIDDKDL